MIFRVQLLNCRFTERETRWDKHFQTLTNLREGNNLHYRSCFWITLYQLYSGNLWRTAISFPSDPELKSNITLISVIWNRVRKWFIQVFMAVSLDISFQKSLFSFICLFLVVSKFIRLNVAAFKDNILYFFLIILVSKDFLTLWYFQNMFLHKTIFFHKNILMATYKLESTLTYINWEMNDELEPGRRSF